MTPAIARHADTHLWFEKCEEMQKCECRFDVQLRNDLKLIYHPIDSAGVRDYAGS